MWTTSTGSSRGGSASSSSWKRRSTILLTPCSTSAAQPSSLSLRTLSARTTAPKRVPPPSSVGCPPRSRTFRQPSQARSRTLTAPASAEGVLVAPDPPHREAAEGEHEDEREGIEPRGRGVDVGADVGHDQERGAVEGELSAPRPHRDLGAALAPDHVDEEGDRDEERDPDQRSDRGQRRLLVEGDHRRRDRGDDQEPAQRRVHLSEEPHRSTVATVVARIREWSRKVSPHPTSSSRRTATRRCRSLRSGANRSSSTSIRRTTLRGAPHRPAGSATRSASSATTAPSSSAS